MTARRPFIRQAELMVWPVRESDNPANDTAIRILSEGSLKSIRMEFTINKSIVGTPNTSQVNLYNLAPETREKFRLTGQKLSLRVGWQRHQDQGAELFEVFNGGLMSAVHNRQGSDIITRLTALTGIEAISQETYSKSYAQGVSIYDILKELSGALHVSWDDTRISPSLLTAKIGRKGYAFAGRVKDTLDNLAGQYGFSWSMQDGVFQALADKQSFANSGVVLSRQAGTLLRATPILSGPMQIQTGVEVLALIVPGITPGDKYYLKSEVNPNLTDMVNGYVAHTICYSGDTGARQWDMNIQSFIDMTAGLNG